MLWFVREIVFGGRTTAKLCMQVLSEVEDAWRIDKIRDFKTRSQLLEVFQSHL